LEHDLPVLVHTPHRDKLEGTLRTLQLIEKAGLSPDRVLIDHNNELTVESVSESGCWMGFTIYPFTKMDDHRMVRILEEFGTERILINSAADWGISDPLKVVKTVEAMRAAGFSEAEVERVVWHNPVEFFGQSGRLELDEVEADRRATFQGNSVLRGERSS
jgi:predicted metal-dependent TIM-barrel fold hydrolase